jgi:hypothetical protein
MSGEELKDLRDRVIVTATRLEQARKDIDLIFGKLDGVANDLKAVTTALTATNTTITKYTVYNKILWPTITVLASLISLLLGLLGVKVI